MNALFEAAVLIGVGATGLGVLLLAALGPMLRFDLMQMAKLNQDGSTTPLPHSPVLKPLFGKEIKWAITAGRKFEKNTETGLLRSESVSIVRFHRQPILALSAYLNSIRVFAEKWTLSGQEVLAVKADKLHQTSRHFLPPGQSFYVAQIDPSTIAVSTSDALMTQILRRRKVFSGSEPPAKCRVCFSPRSRPPGSTFARRRRPGGSSGSGRERHRSAVAGVVVRLRQQPL